MITDQEMSRLAELAKLSLDNINEENLREDLESLVAFAGQIAGIPASGSECPQEAAELRPDCAEASEEQSVILRNAAVTQGEYFVVTSGGAYENDP